MLFSSGKSNLGCCCCCCISREKRGGIKKSLALFSLCRRCYTPALPLTAVAAAVAFQNIGGALPVSPSRLRVVKKEEKSFEFLCERKEEGDRGGVEINTVRLLAGFWQLDQFTAFSHLKILMRKFEKFESFVFSRPVWHCVGKRVVGWGGNNGRHLHLFLGGGWFWVWVFGWT